MESDEIECYFSPVFMVINTERYVGLMTIEEYNTASQVYSAWVRDQGINQEGVFNGYFKKKLNHSNLRGRGKLLKNTGVRYTVDVLYGPLADVAETMSKEVSEGYDNFLMVNSCSSKIRYSTPKQRGWTELCGVFFDEYNAEYNLVEDGVTWEEYQKEFKDVYGIEAGEYGSWDLFYNLFSDYFKEVAQEYMSRLMKTLIGRDIQELKENDLYDV